MANRSPANGLWTRLGCGRRCYMQEHPGPPATGDLDGVCGRVRSAWIKEQHVRVRDGSIKEFQVNMMVTFVIDD